MTVQERIAENRRKASEKYNSDVQKDIDRLDELRRTHLKKADDLTGQINTLVAAKVPVVIEAPTPETK